MKVTLKVILIVSFLFVVTFASEVIKIYMKGDATGNVPLAEKESKIESLDRLMRTSIEEQAKTLPMRVDGSTEVFQILYMKGQIHTSYRLLNIDVADFQKDAFINQVYPLLREKICVEPGTEIFRERGEYSSHYKYYDRNDNHLSTIIIDERDCEQQ